MYYALMLLISFIICIHHDVGKYVFNYFDILSMDKLCSTIFQIITIITKSKPLSSASLCTDFFTQMD